MSDNQDPAGPEPSIELVEEETMIEPSKLLIRQKVWNYFKNRSRRPVNGRLPNFKGAKKAATMLSNLEIFKAAKVIKVNPDGPQKAIRCLALQANKGILIPSPRLQNGLWNLIKVTEGAGPGEIKDAISRCVTGRCGKPLGFNAKIKIDLVVMGAVAVSKEGHRIGKGEGFADLEYAILASMGAVTADTIVVTTVDEGQVFETLPKHLFEPYDVPVDVIITPTKVYYTSRRLPKPNGIIWGLLSSKRLSKIPVLKALRENLIAAGDSCILEVDSDMEEQKRPRIKSEEKGVVGTVVKEGEGDDLEQPPGTSNSTCKPMEEAGDSCILEVDSDMEEQKRPRIMSEEKGVVGTVVKEVEGDDLEQQPGTFNSTCKPMEEAGDSFILEVDSDMEEQKRPRITSEEKGIVETVVKEGEGDDLEQPPGTSNSTCKPMEEAGDGCVLKEVDSDIDMRPRFEHGFFKWVGRGEGGGGDLRQPQSRFSSPRKPKEGSSMEGLQGATKWRRNRRSRKSMDFSVYIGNIGMEVRVQNLKSVMAERGVKPRRITWRGSQGFAFLHFIKGQGPGVNMESIIALMQNIKLGANLAGDSMLKIAPA